MPSTMRSLPRNLRTGARAGVKGLTLLVMAAMVLVACNSTPKRDTPALGASGPPNPPPAPAGTPTTAAGGEEGKPAVASRSRRPPLRAAPREPERTRCGNVSGGKAGGLAHLVDVRLGSHAGYDRMTFVFEPASVPTPDGGRIPPQSGTPRYEVGTATPPPFVEDPSDRPMTVSGGGSTALGARGCPS